MSALSEVALQAIGKVLAALKAKGIVFPFTHLVIRVFRPDGEEMGWGIVYPTLQPAKPSEDKAGGSLSYRGKVELPSVFGTFQPYVGVKEAGQTMAKKDRGIMANAFNQAMSEAMDADAIARRQAERDSYAHEQNKATLSELETARRQLAEAQAMLETLTRPQPSTVEQGQAVSGDYTSALKDAAAKGDTIAAQVVDKAQRKAASKAQGERQTAKA